jgi:hypothetical protein
MFITVAGIASGLLQATFGYVGFFISVIVATVPGLVTLLVIPLDGSPIVG